MKTREEQVEEMAKAIYATGVALDGTDYAFGVYDDDDHFHRMASALIEAGIGDVKEAEHRAEVAERALRNCVEYYRFTHLCPIPDCAHADKCWGERCVSDIAEYLEEQTAKELAEEEK